MEKNKKNWREIWTFSKKFETYDFVYLKSNLALLYNKGHNFWKSLSTWKIPPNWILPYWKIISPSLKFCSILLFIAIIAIPRFARAGKQAI